MSHGRVIEERRGGRVDYFGNVVNAAARLLRRSSGGGIALSARVSADPRARRLLASARFVADTARLKGFSEEVAILSLDPASLPLRGDDPGLEAFLRRELRESYARAVRVSTP